MRMMMMMMMMMMRRRRRRRMRRTITYRNEARGFRDECLVAPRLEMGNVAFFEDDIIDCDTLFIVSTVCV
jgi:hypothetical protein